MKKRNAFTLAEVLIALVIIGVIASMTIPTLLNNTNSQEYRTALKKSIAVINQAVTLHYALEGKTVADYTTANDLRDGLLMKRLNVVSTSLGLGYKGSGTATVVTADGIAYSFQSSAACDDSGQTVCYNVFIDVNGDKKPNIMTVSTKTPKDGYQAALYSQRLVPTGAITQGVMYDQGLYYD